MAVRGSSCTRLGRRPGHPERDCASASAARRQGCALRPRCRQTRCSSREAACTRRGRAGTKAETPSSTPSSTAPGTSRTRLYSLVSEHLATFIADIDLCRLFISEVRTASDYRGSAIQRAQSALHLRAAQDRRSGHRQWRDPRRSRSAPRARHVVRRDRAFVVTLCSRHPAARCRRHCAVDDRHPAQQSGGAPAEARMTAGPNATSREFAPTLGRLISACHAVTLSFYRGADR
jgi:hypothetical protein